MKSQCLRWDEFANSFEAWRPLLNNEFKGVSQDSGFEYDITSLILDDFVRLLFMSVGLSIYITLLSSVELALGFIRFDQKRSPRSLLVASTIVVLLAIPVILWLNSSNFEYQTKGIAVFVLSVFLSVIPVFLVNYDERFEFVIVSAAWGVVSGAILAPLGSLLCLAIAAGIRKKTGRNVLGIVFYVATTALLTVELIVSLVD